MKNLMSIIIPIFLLTSLTTAQDDITPPELTYFSFTPDSVDVTDSSAVIDLTAGAVDDMSGMGYVQVGFHSPSGAQGGWPGFSFGGSMSDTLTTQMTIDQYSESGEWYVDHIYVSDEVGNYQYYYTSELDSLGYETGLYVMEESQSDTTEVSGIISSNTTWGALSSPYIVTGNILLTFAQFSPASKTSSFQNQKAKVTTRPLKYRNFETSEIRNEIKIYIFVCQVLPIISENL